MIYRRLILILMLLCPVLTEAQQESCKPFFTKGKKIALAVCGTVAIGGLIVIGILRARSTQTKKDELQISEPTFVKISDTKLFNELSSILDKADTEEELDESLNEFKIKGGKAYIEYAAAKNELITTKRLRIRKFKQLIKDAECAGIAKNLICDENGKQNTEAFIDMLVLRAVVGNGPLRDAPNPSNATEAHVQLLENALKYGGNSRVYTPKTDAEDSVPVFQLAVSKCRMFVEINMSLSADDVLVDLTNDRQVIRVLLQHKAHKYKDSRKNDSALDNIKYLMRNDPVLKKTFEQYGYKYIPAS